MSKIGNLRIEDASSDGDKSLLERCMRIDDGELSLIPQYPINMMIEVTSICNHNCIFCANSKSNIKAFIDRDVAIKCLEEGFSLGVREVGLFSRGEPLLDKNLVDYVRIAKSIGYSYIYFTTNGSLLTNELARGLIDAGLDSIKFSINAGTRERYELIHGRDDFDTVYNNVYYLRNYIDSVGSKCKVYISSVICKYTNGDQELLRKKYKDIVDEIEFFNVVNQGGAMPENAALFVDGTNTSGTGESVCMMPFNRFIITAEGYVDLCCVDYYNYLVVGDVKKNTLSEIWASDKFVSARRMFMNRNYGKMLCRNCLECEVREVLPLTMDCASELNIYSVSKADEIEARINRFSRR